MNHFEHRFVCTDSIWGTRYSCSHIVEFCNYRDHGEEDWALLVDEKSESILDHGKLEFLERVRPNLSLPNLSLEEKLRRSTSFIPGLKPHVIKWLNDNVLDRIDDECSKGWCIGSPSYISCNEHLISVFFHRETDALAFIKEFSTLGKPYIYQYYNNPKIILNIENDQYEMID